MLAYSHEKFGDEYSHTGNGFPAGASTETDFPGAIAEAKAPNHCRQVENSVKQTSRQWEPSTV
jgi:hypothetical protein